MTKEVALSYLRREKHTLKISVIAEETSISNLAKIIDEKPDGRGYPSTLADHHLPALINWITSHCNLQL